MKMKALSSDFCYYRRFRFPSIIINTAVCSRCTIIVLCNILYFQNSFSLKTACCLLADKDLVSKPSDQVEEAESRQRHQLSHACPAVLTCRSSWAARRS